MSEDLVKALSDEAEKYRKHLEKQLEHLKWAVATMAIVFAGAFVFITAKTYSGMKTTIEAQVSDKIITFEFDQKVMEKVEASIEQKLKSNATQRTVNEYIGVALKESTSESLSKQAEKILNERIDKFGIDEVKASLLPPGSIVPWDPVVRNEKGEPTGRLRELPLGWLKCDGRNGTPDLQARFLVGVVQDSEAGAIGGSNVIAMENGHSHSGTTGSARNPELRFTPDHDRAPGSTGSGHFHDYSTNEAGSHNHGGDNRPLFYSVIYIVKMS